MMVKAGLRAALDALCKGASEAIKSGYTIIVLSDRGVNAEHAAIRHCSRPAPCIII